MRLHLPAHAPASAVALVRTATPRPPPQQAPTRHPPEVEGRQQGASVHQRHVARVHLVLDCKLPVEEELCAGLGKNGGEGDLFGSGHLRLGVGVRLRGHLAHVEGLGEEVVVLGVVAHARPLGHLHRVLLLALGRLSSERHVEGSGAAGSSGGGETVGQAVSGEGDGCGWCWAGRGLTPGQGCRVQRRQPCCETPPGASLLLPLPAASKEAARASSRGRAPPKPRQIAAAAPNPIRLAFYPPPSYRSSKVLASRAEAGAALPTACDSARCRSAPPAGAAAQNHLSPRLPAAPTWCECCPWRPGS
jgi:hypothetical protein